MPLHVPVLQPLLQKPVAPGYYWFKCSGDWLIYLFDGLNIVVRDTDYKIDRFIEDFGVTIILGPIEPPVEVTG